MAMLMAVLSDQAYRITITTTITITITSTIPIEPMLFARRTMFHAQATRVDSCVAEYY
jgi:hypothetical protein